MPTRVISVGMLACLALLAAAFAEAAPAVAAPDRKPPEKAQATKPPPFRDTSGYRYPAVSGTVRDMQNAAHAMQLREYCADARVPDAFVKEQLARFSRITGRAETCSTLLSY